MAVKLSPSSCNDGDGNDGGGVTGRPGTGDEALEECLGVSTFSFSSCTRPAEEDDPTTSRSGLRPMKLEKKPDIRFELRP